MELLNTLMNMEPAQLVVAGMVILVIFSGSSGASGVSEEDEANEAYLNASWNPASVNYNE